MDSLCMLHTVTFFRRNLKDPVELSYFPLHPLRIQTRYSELGKGLLSLTTAVKMAEKLPATQEIAVQSPFSLLKAIFKGTPPGKGVV